MSEEERENDVVQCERCGCLGNMSCGHEPLNKDEGCSLNECLICRCCEIKGVDPIRAAAEELWKWMVTDGMYDDHDPIPFLESILLREVERERERVADIAMEYITHGEASFQRRIRQGE